MDRLFALLIAPLALPLVAGCSDDDPDKLADVAGFCREWAVETCNKTVIEACSEDEAECENAQAAFCETLVKPVSQYSRSGAAACIKAVGAAYTDGKLNAEEYQTVIQLGGACEKVLSGNGGPGDICNETKDCDTSADLECIIKLGETTGQCQIPEEVGGGDACDGPTQVCAEGFYCDGENCLRKPGEGDECSALEPCDSATRCAAAPAGDAGTTAGGTCVPKASNGDDCSATDNPISNECTTGLCGSNGVCIPSITVSAENETNLCENFHD